MAHVIPFPKNRRAESNVVGIPSATPYAPIVSLYTAKPLWPPSDMLAPDTDTDGCRVELPCNTEPADPGAEKG